MKLLIIGTGYVGLVTGACFAEVGHEVVCLDKDAEKIRLLQRGTLPFYEPGLEELIQRNRRAGRLHFTTELQEALPGARVSFIAVGTPSLPDGSCDLKFVLAAAREIAERVNGDHIIAIKSTVPVGTHAQVKAVVQEALEARGLSLEVPIVSNPEFLKEGAAVQDCMKPDRIVLGVDNEEAMGVMREIYSSFSLSRDRILIMEPPSAEMTKYASNAMLAARVSFMNEFAQLCERVGADIRAVRLGIGADQRIGYAYLYAGVGFGGSCLPKDLRALSSLGKSLDCPLPMVAAIQEVNQRQKRLLGEKIIAYFREQGRVHGRTVAIWGLSFKPDTDDMREAPSLELIEQLSQEGIELRLYDPVACAMTQRLLGERKGITYCRDAYEAALHADAIALVTEWKEFRQISFERILSKMVGRGFFDGRNQYLADEMERRGFDYFCVGSTNPAKCASIV